jgi:DNA-directed RNA polymerase subunit M/transcription elongation factor TFIIS
MQCPSCQKEVGVKDKDFGALFKCPSCGDVYFLNFDGTPDFSEMQAQPSAEELHRLQNQNIPDKKKKKKSSKESSDLEQHEVDAHVQPDQTQAADVPHEVNSGFQLQSSDNFSLPEVAESEPLQESYSIEPMTDNFQAEPLPIEAFPTESPTIENFSYESSSAVAEVSEVAASVQPASQNFGSIASELESFGNRQTVVAGISYDLEVTGLDSKEAQELMREAIDDSRLGWHTEDIVREIRTGTCRFKNLTPVQAFVLAKRIQFIDIEMKWKQNVLA